MEAPRCKQIQESACQHQRGGYLYVFSAYIGIPKHEESRKCNANGKNEKKFADLMPDDWFQKKLIIGSLENVYKDAISVKEHPADHCKND